MNQIQADELILGRNVSIDPTAVVRGIAGPARRVVIGDNTYIGRGVQILCDHFEIGDYGKIHHDTNVHGRSHCLIGHNAWIGQYTILDATGGLKIGDNCGIGAHSQLWTHIKYGDRLEGCRFFAESPSLIGNDVWFVGHCIVAPITAHDRSMALAGSVVTRDMELNHIYAGSPAVDVTAKLGTQFEPQTLESKFARMLEYQKSFGNSDRIRIVRSRSEFDWEDDITYFDVSSRTYKKTGSNHEVSFMKFLLPEKAKFTPAGWP